MSLFGSRATLIANVCALIVASIVAVEAGYIDHKVLGINASNNYWDAFFPAFVMFVIRNSIFSWPLLLLYIALAIQMFYQSQLIFFGSYDPGPRGELLGYLGLFLFISMGCLAIYAAGVLVWFANSFFDSKR